MIYDIFKTLIIVLVTIPVLAWTRILSSGWIQFLIFLSMGLLGGLASRYFISNLQIGLLVPYYFLIKAYLTRGLYEGFSKRYIPAILYFVAYYFPYIQSA